MKNWYQIAHEYCLELSDNTGYSLEIVVGVLVSLSSQKKWELNKIQAKDFLTTGNIVTGMTNKMQIYQSTRIINGDKPEKVWSKTALKYREFYKCILNPQDTTAVCIDSIMIRWYKSVKPFSILLKKSKGQIFKSKRLYAIIQKEVRRLAKLNNILPLEQQALIWVENR